MLPEILEYSIFVLYGKAETSSAGEQLVRNSHSYWNCNLAGYFPAYINKTILVIYASKNSFIFAFCLFYAGAVQFPF